METGVAGGQSGKLFDLYPDKVRVAIERLRAHEPAEGYWLAFSGGKDSQCVYHLAEMAGVKFEAHFSVTTVDPPELLGFIREHYPDVECHRPALSMFQLIVKHRVPPSRFARYCCSTLKEPGGAGRVLILGIRAAESRRRAKRRIYEACQRGRGRWFLNPILDWSDEDVWRFLKEGGHPHCSLYDEGFERIGCIMCPAVTSKQMMRDAERWPKFAGAYRAAFKRMLEARREHEKATGKATTGWLTVDEVWDWWMNDRGKYADNAPDEGCVLPFEDQ